MWDVPVAQNVFERRYVIAFTNNTSVSSFPLSFFGDPV